MGAKTVVFWRDTGEGGNCALPPLRQPDGVRAVLPPGKLGDAGRHAQPCVRVLRRLLAMCGHHLVEPSACNPRSAWKKGQVESQVSYVRHRGSGVDRSRRSTHGWRGCALRTPVGGGVRGYHEQGGRALVSGQSFQLHLECCPPGKNFLRGGRAIAYQFCQFLR